MIIVDITDPNSFLKFDIQEALRTVMDPELCINIIDLGLVYGISVDETDKLIVITMTLSSRHCPMGDALMRSAENCIKHRFSTYLVRVDLTWEPQWNYEKISEDGLRQLNG